LGDECVLHKGQLRLSPRKLSEQREWKSYFVALVDSRQFTVQYVAAIRDAQTTFIDKIKTKKKKWRSFYKDIEKQFDVDCQFHLFFWEDESTMQIGDCPQQSIPLTRNSKIQTSPSCLEYSHVISLIQRGMTFTFVPQDATDQGLWFGKLDSCMDSYDIVCDSGYQTPNRFRRVSRGIQEEDSSVIACGTPTIDNNLSEVASLCTNAEYATPAIKVDHETMTNQVDFQYGNDSFGNESFMSRQLSQDERDAVEKSWYTNQNNINNNNKRDVRDVFPEGLLTSEREVPHSEREDLSPETVEEPQASQRQDASDESPQQREDTRPRQKPKCRFRSDNTLENSSMDRQTTTELQQTPTDPLSPTSDTRPRQDSNASTVYIESQQNNNAVASNNRNVVRPRTRTISVTVTDDDGERKTIETTVPINIGHLHIHFD